MRIDDIRRWLVDYLHHYPSKFRQIAIWREPIMACAPADDHFRQLKGIAASSSLIPLLAEFQTTGMFKYVGDLKQGPNTEIGPKDNFETPPQAICHDIHRYLSLELLHLFTP